MRESEQRCYVSIHNYANAMFAYSDAVVISARGPQSADAETSLIVAAAWISAILRSILRRKTTSLMRRRFCLKPGVESTFILLPEYLPDLFYADALISLGKLFFHHPHKDSVLFFLGHVAVPEVVSDNRRLFVGEVVEVIDQPIY